MERIRELLNMAQHGSLSAFYELCQLLGIDPKTASKDSLKVEPIKLSYRHTIRKSDLITVSLEDKIERIEKWLAHFL